MEAPASILSVSLQGRRCHVSKRECDWCFSFEDRVHIAVSVPWRVVSGGGIRYGDEDDEQAFGLAQPIDGEKRTNELLDGQKVVGTEVDEQTSDLRIMFDGGARLDFFNNSSGYEGWQAIVPVGRKELTIIALGGGGLASC